MFDRHAIIDAATMNALSNVMGVAVLRMGGGRWPGRAMRCASWRRTGRPGITGRAGLAHTGPLGINAGGLPYGHIGELKLHGGTEANLVLDMRNVLGRLASSQADEDAAVREFQDELELKRRKRGHK